jgi:hypothetical protein
LSSLLTQLSERLDDENFVYWTLPELTLIIQESLRTFQAFSGYWRGRMTFNTFPSQPFYDLTQQTGTLIPYTVTDSYLLSLMLYQLIEKQLSSGSYVGTDMFILDDFTKALERRRNQFLVETGMVLSQVMDVSVSPPSGRVSIPDNVIDVRRVLWNSPGQGTPYGSGGYGVGPYDGTISSLTNLWRSNEFGAQAFKPGWALEPQDPPSEYSVAAEPPLTLQLIPPPLNPGSLTLLAVLAGATLNPSAGVLMGIPDNFSWVVKFGALADLLMKAGQAQDMPRASYCENRWKQGIDLARTHTSAVYAAIDGKDALINALASLDAFNPNWINENGPPTDVALASWNMLAVSPYPDTNNHSVRLDVIQNAPVPVLLTDQIQIGREELDALLDYAQHLSMFKLGGQEFLSTTPLFENMFRVAGIYNERLRANISFLQPMADRAGREEELKPRRSAQETPTAA